MSESGPPNRGNHNEHYEEWKEWFVDRAFRRAALNFLDDLPPLTSEVDAHEWLELLWDAPGSRFDAFVESGGLIHVFVRLDKDIPFHVVYDYSGSFLSISTQEV